MRLVLIPPLGRPLPAPEWLVEEKTEGPVMR